MDLKKISGIEIFSAGTWNGDTYTTKDLDEMVRAFEENKEFRPFVKLGHDPKQKLIQEDGLPAAGWIDRIYREGEKLVADVVDIPAKIFDLISKRAYRKVSSEIYWNIDINGKKYSRFLGAVALLGANLPGVQNLADILALYGFKDFETLKTYAKIDEAVSKNYLYDTGEDDMPTEQELKLKADLEAKEKEYAAKLKEKEAALTDQEKELAELKEFKANAEKEKADLEAKLQAEKIDNFASDLVKEELASKAMVPYIKEFLGAEKKEYSFEDKKFSKGELLKETLKLFKASLDASTESETEVGKKESRSESALEGKIDAYMSENKCSYSVAYKAVMKSTEENSEDE